MATQTGTNGIDTLTASLLDGEDLNGLEGNDLLIGDAATNVMFGAEGNDYLTAGAGVDFLFGGNGSSNVTGTDVIEGGLNDDFIFGGGSSDLSDIITMVCSYSDCEFDLTAYLNSNAGVTVHLNDHKFLDPLTSVWVGSSTGGQGEDTLLGIEGVIGSKYDDHLTGPYNSQNMTELDGSKWIIPFEIPRADEDYHSCNIQYYIHASEGNDVINGVLAPAEALVVDQVNDLVPPPPTYILDPQLADMNGLLRGGTGDDIIFGGSGNDLIYGGSADDIVDGGGGFNTMCYDTSPDAVNVDLSLEGSPDNTDSTAGTDTLKNIQGLSGTNFDDTLAGDNNCNTLIGLLGNDTLTGREGKDIFVFNLSVNDGDDIIMDMNANETKDILKFTSINHTVDSVSEIDAMIASGGITGDATHTLVTFMNGASIDFKGLDVNGFDTSDGKAHSIADFGCIETGDLYFTQLPPDYKPFDVQSVVPPIVV